MIYISILMYKRYKIKTNITTKHLFISITSYGFAAISSAIGKYIDFYSKVPQRVASYSNYTINIAYVFTAIGSIFLYSFIEEIFHRDHIYRKYFFAITEGIVAGLIIGLNSVDYSSYQQMIPAIAILIVLSSWIYISLIVYSIRYYKKSNNKQSRIGFSMFAMYGVFLILVFVSFLIDVIIVTLKGTAYNIEYYLGWTFATLASISAYLGYVMPSWFKSIMGVNKK